MLRTVNRTKTKRVDWIERGAVIASVTCLVHCLALPVVLAALPALSRAFPASESFHLAILAFAAPTSGAALISGRARHRATAPLLLGGAGLVAMLAGAVVLDGATLETVVTVAGSVTLAAAHVWNWRLRHAAAR